MWHLQETHSEYKHTSRAGRNIPCNRKHKKTVITILISDKLDFKTKVLEEIKKGHSSKRHDNPNLYVPNKRTSKFMRQKPRKTKDKNQIENPQI